MAILSTALVLQLIISRQGRYAGSVQSSERALYAAATGFESISKVLVNRQIDAIGNGICYSGELSYDQDQVAEYVVWGKIIEGSSDICTYSHGKYGDVNRYLSSGQEQCVQELITQSLNESCESS